MYEKRKTRKMKTLIFLFISLLWGPCGEALNTAMKYLWVYKISGTFRIICERKKEKKN